MTLNDIIHIDSAQIVRIQEQLKAKAIPENTNTLEELSELVGQLENQEIKEAHLFIESHLWLKKILLAAYEDLDINAFDSTYNPRKATAYTKTFITPFLLQSLTATLAYLFSKQKFHLVVRFVSQGRFFSEEVKQEIIRFFATQLNNANRYIAQGKLKESQHPVSFLKNSDFIESINSYITALIDEVTGIHNTILRIYNHNQRVVNNEWDFAISIMVAFGKLVPSNQNQQEVFTKNASIAKSHSFKSSLLELDARDSKKRSLKKTYPIIIIAAIIVFITIGATILISKSNPSNDYNKDDNDIYSKKNSRENQEDPYSDSDELVIIEEKEIEETVLETTEPEIQTEEEGSIKLEETTLTFIPEYITLPNQVKRYTQDSHIRFLYSLNRKVVKGDDIEAEEIIKITPFTNPYPKTFNTIATDVTSSSSQLEVINSTQKKLIVFKLQDGVDQAIIIPENEKGILDFKQGDSIVFYTGNDFTSSRFSHFTKKQDVSSIYKITSLATHSKIDVLPFKDNPRFTKNPKFHRSIESLTFYGVETEKLKAIETLYRNFYNTYYQQ
ncbi:MAG: hypothetical protein ACI9Y7_002149 [Dokdonia sp.]|jgi:hypothetical protein